MLYSEFGQRQPDETLSSFASAMRAGTPLCTFVLEMERLAMKEIGPTTLKTRNIDTVLLEAKGDEEVRSVLKRNVRVSIPRCEDSVAFLKDVGGGFVRDLRDDLQVEGGEGAVTL